MGLNYFLFQAVVQPTVTNSEIKRRKPNLIRKISRIAFASLTFIYFIFIVFHVRFLVDLLKWINTWMIGVQFNAKYLLN